MSILCIIASVEKYIIDLGNMICAAYIIVTIKLKNSQKKISVTV